MYVPGVVKGLWVTIVHFIESYLNDFDHFPRRYYPDGRFPRMGPQDRGIFTVQYPEERLEMYPRFRGSLVQMRNPETGEPLCTGCGACARACPQGTIHLVTSGKGSQRIVETFEVDNRDCMVCGLCVEACPFGALKMGHNYELASYEADSLVFDMEKLLALGDAHAATLKEQ